ncbi:cold shock domain-containing protein [Vibrio rotiferianus]
MKWFNEDKGYGFIYVGDEEDHYFHVKTYRGALPTYEGR